MTPLGTFLRGVAARPNASPVPLRITLARRLVETPGAPFVPTGEVFTEVASARDELGLLPATQGPTVVRVQVEGGATADREALVGDWLLDPDGGNRVLRLPEPRWTYSDEAMAWGEARPWLEAWETCQEARWMLKAAGEAGIDRKLLILAACACARTALRFVPKGELRPLRAIETAERWTRGEATLEMVRTASATAWAATSDAARPTARAAVNHNAVTAASAAVWAVSAASASDAASDAARAAAIAAYAAYADAATSADPNAWAMYLARSADLVRREIPTLVVLRAVATSA